MLMAILQAVKTITAARFKDQCLKIMDTVVRTKSPIVVTKRGRPVVKVVPYTETPASSRSLAGSIRKESGSPYSTGEKWDADLS
ncbi:MAG: type II toxin-antitoxin system prevent-host-death family antitoxin [Acidobacteria bacterium]|nr:MAG: type II toxin-antitoxin system prevent-host-death family antitoxin [Acidobacteriota bacterium]